MLFWINTCGSHPIAKRKKLDGQTGDFDKLKGLNYHA